MIDYLSRLCSISWFIEKFKNDTLEVFFKDSVEAKQDYFFSPRYESFWQVLRNIADICDVLEIEKLQGNKESIVVVLESLRFNNPARQKQPFVECVDNLKEYFQEAENEAKEKISLLEDNERIRLNEALNCYVEQCNYSTVVMSVSAVESRLYSLMVSKNSSEEAELEKLTLGQLIREYSDNKEQYGSVVLKKHLPLLDYCNVYRVFSAHPKREKVTRANATAIMSMTFSFLFDKEQKAKIQ